MAEWVKMFGGGGFMEGVSQGYGESGQLPHSVPLTLISHPSLSNFCLCVVPIAKYHAMVQMFFPR